MSTVQSNANPRRTAPVRVANIGLGGIAISFSVLADWLASGEPGFGRMQQLMFGGGLALVLAGFLSTAWNSRILLLLIVSGISLAAGEATLRAFVGPYFSTVYQIDDRYIYRLLPNATKMFKRAAIEGGESIVVHINDRGFRDAVWSAAPPPGARRVAVYGDSFIEGEFSNFEATFVSRLKVHLSKDLAKPIDAMNAGVSGYGPDQAYARIADELPASRSDLLIVSIYAGNDFGDLVRNKLFRLGADGSLVRNTWRLAPHLRASFDRAASGLLLSKLVEKRWRGLKLSMEEDPDELEGAAPWMAYQQRDYEAFVLRGDNVVTNVSNDYLDIDVSAKPHSDAVRYKVALMRGVLAGIKASAAAANTPLLLLIVPPADDVCQECEGLRKEVAAYAGYDRDRTTAMLEGLARELSIPAVSLLKTFRSSDPDSLYFKQDTHWNDAGQDLAARVVSQYIRSSQIIH